MVSGITQVTGDPYLQRQNEPSMAVSTRNPLHLLAGANDYRNVSQNTDTTPGQSVAADAWLGVFRSYNGGATWISSLLPGYPGDTSAAGLASPLAPFPVASDPTVRPAPAGLFYYSGIAFNRTTNLGAVFVSTFMDLNNEEAGDPIRNVNTLVVDSGTTGQFLDKPSIAVGLPTGGTCNLQVQQADGTRVTQSVPAAPVYLLWSRFTGSTSTKIMISQSLNCGASWSQPVKLSESNSINQGTSVAIAPTGQNIFVAWRRFATSSQPDAIVVATSSDGGNTWSKSVDVVDLGAYNSATPNAPAFFDQPSTSSSVLCPTCGQFRTNAFPTIAVDGNGRAYLAWSQRGAPNATNGEARIAMSTSMDGVNWSTPFFVDKGALNDRGLNVLTTSATPLVAGHQFMPALTSTGGLLTLAYYDQREDHTVDLFTPNNPWARDANGFFYNEALALQDCASSFSTTLCDPLGAVFTPFLSDANLTRRHTIDVVMAQATPAATPTFVTARVSQYKTGLSNDGSDISGEVKQLQFNPPNLPLFASGTTPFIGDYLDVAGQSFLPPGSSGAAWTFNTSPQGSPFHFVTWTDNRDVRAPSDGNWTVYTPPGSANCDPGHVADRNQNIYVSRVTQGLALSSPQNTKSLSTSLQRAFTIVVQNFTNFDKTFRLSIASQPPGGWASFTPGTNNPPNPPTAPSPVTAVLDLAVAAHSGVSRPLFATSSTSAATITVNAAEITGLGGTLVSGGMTGFVVLNPDPSAAALSGPISSVETYDPSITNPIFDETLTTIGINGSLTNDGLSNGSLTNTELSNGSLTNGSLTNGSLTNGSLTNGSLTNGSLTNGSLTNGSLTNGSLTNGSLTNGSLTNTAVTDATYTVTNHGDTTGSYTVNLVGTNITTTGQFLQLIASKTYYTPFANDCSGTQQQPQSIILANVNVPTVQAFTSGSLTNTNITNGSLTNMTLSIAPGDSIEITVRGLGVTTTEMQQVTRQLAPVVVAQAANTNDATNAPKFAAPLFITTTTTNVPNGLVNTPYSSTTIQAIGGTVPYSWSVVSGSLPPGLTLNSMNGTISGTPSAAGVFNFTIQVADSSTPQKTAQLALTINIYAQLVITTTSLPGGIVGSPYSQLVLTSGGSGHNYVWSATGLPPFLTIGPTSGTISLVNGQNGTPGTFNVTVSVSDPGPPAQHASQALSVTFTENTTVTVTASPNPALFGVPVTASVTVSPSTAGTGTPTGSVSVSDSTGASCKATLVNGSGTCNLTPLSVSASDSLSATYTGDTLFNGNSGTTLLVVNKTTTTFALTLNPAAAVVGQPVQANVTVTPSGTVSSSPSGSVSVSDGAGATCTATLSATTQGQPSSGNCTLVPSSTGTRTVQASYAGDASFLASNASASLAVTQASTSTTVSSPQTTAVAGQTITANFQVNANAPNTGTPVPTGTVTVKNSTGGSCTGTLSNGAGSCNLVVGNTGTSMLSGTYSGDGNYLGSSSGQTPGPVVGKANTATTITTSPGTTVVGQPYSVNVKVAPAYSGVPSGTVAASDGTNSCTITLSSGAGSCSLVSAAAGSGTVTGTYGGDSNFNNSSGTTTQTVNPASTATAITSVSPNPVTIGQSVAVNFAVAVVAPGAGTPAGNVTVTDGTGASCVGPLNSGAGSCLLTPTSVGTKTLVASFASANGNYTASASLGVVLQVNKANSTTTVTLSPNPAFLAQPVTVSVTVGGNGPSPTGSISVSDTTGATCSITLSGGKGSCSITPKTVGTDTITATYSGDGNYNGSSGSVTQQKVLYEFTGFYGPLGAAGTYSGAFNFGKTIPIKWTLTDNNNNLISSLSSLNTMVAFFNGPQVNGTCSINASGPSELLYSPTNGAAGNSTFRYSSGQFIFNWDTTSADPLGKGCFTLLVQLNDGSSQLTSMLMQ
jgi:hypothetical protein